MCRSDLACVMAMSGSVMDSAHVSHTLVGSSRIERSKGSSCAGGHDGSSLKLPLLAEGGHPRP